MDRWGLAVAGIVPLQTPNPTPPMPMPTRYPSIELALAMTTGAPTSSAKLSGWRAPMTRSGSSSTASAGGAPNRQIPADALDDSRRQDQER